MTEQQLEAIRSMVRHCGRSGYYQKHDGTIAIFNPDNQKYCFFTLNDRTNGIDLIGSSKKLGLSRYWKFVSLKGSNSNA